MKRIRVISVLLAVAVLAALLVLPTTSKHTVQAVYAQSGCTVATLAGNYATSDQGFSAPGHSVSGTEVPFVAVGVNAYDGAGNITFTGSASLNGSASAGNTFSGTYTVNPDCTGSISFPTVGVNANIVIIGGGTELFGIFTEPGSTVTTHDKKQ